MSLFCKAQFFDANQEKASKDYQHKKKSIIEKDKVLNAGKFGEFVKGVKVDVNTTRKELALTLDACGGPHGNGYDSELIDFLRQEKIPATLFIAGRWIDDHLELFKALANDTLFEIENHGLNHKPCSVTKESPYGIDATDSIGAAIDEMELNARKIKFYTDERPIFYRSATAETDEACGKVAEALGMQIVGFDILSGDVGGTKVSLVKQNILAGLKNGAIIIGHMNHPEWNIYEALKAALPTIRKKGYKFIKLERHQLMGRY